MGFVKSLFCKSGLAESCKLAATALFGLREKLSCISGICSGYIFVLLCESIGANLYFAAASVHFAFFFSMGFVKVWLQSEAMVVSANVHSTATTFCSCTLEF